MRQQQQVPAGIVATLAGISARLAQQDLFEGGTARVMLDALKAIAQSEAPTLDIAELGQVVGVLLTAIHLIQVRNSEAEMIDLLCAMNRLDRRYLAGLVRVECPVLAQKGWLRNISAVIKTIRRVDGPRSVLFR